MALPAKRSTRKGVAMHRKKRRWLSWFFAPALAIAITGIGYLSTLAATVHAVPVVAPAAHRVTTVRHVRHVPHQARPTTVRIYTVRTGDTLSAIAEKVYGSANAWPALWWVNRSTVTNPNSLSVGEVLTLSDWHPIKSWLLTAAVEAE